MWRDDSNDSTLRVIDRQGIILDYLKAMKVTTPQEVVIDYDMLTLRHPEIVTDFAKHWYEMAQYVEVYFGMLDVDDDTPHAVFLRGYHNDVPIAKLRNKHINKIVTIDGIVRKISESKEEIVSSRWRCSSCGCLTSRMRGLNEPTSKCACGSKKYDLCEEECLFQDVQFISLQETQAPNGRQPKSLKCTVRGSMVDLLQAGNRCTLTGVVNVEIDRKTGLATLWLDVLTCERPDDDYIDIQITDEDVSRIKTLARDPDVYRNLLNSINPAIWGYDEVKLALILQMFGGVTVESNTAERIRGDSHILLCGDPSMAKSQMIRSIAKIVPRCVYTSGRSTSAAGLTVAAVRDEMTGQWTLEAGALVLANGAFSVIDEFDKLSDSDRSAMHEAMESQSISVAKAGINQTLNTRCPVLAAANPKMGRFIEAMPLAEQVNLPPALLSRFDLIFMMLDKPNKDNDEKVASNILDLTDKALSGEVTRPVDVDLLRKYIIYAKQFNPKLPADVKNYLKSKYIDIRSDENSTITPRQLEALKRLTQASARVQLKDVADIDNAKMAVSLFEYSMNSITLGKGIDSSYFDSKQTSVQNKTTNVILNIVGEHGHRGVKFMSEIASTHGIDPIEFNDLIFKLMDDDLIRCETMDGIMVFTRSS